MTLSLKPESNQMFRKPNKDPMYTNINSNHPRQKLKKLPQTINRTLSKHFSLKEVVDKSKMIYEKSLSNSGPKENLIYHQDNGIKNKNKNIKKCQRKIIWFNTPFSKILKTNIFKRFFQLINRHFQNSHKKSKIFINNAIKLNHSGCRNVGLVTDSLNL